MQVSQALSQREFKMSLVSLPLQKFACLSCCFCDCRKLNSINIQIKFRENRSNGSKRGSETRSNRQHSHIIKLLSFFLSLRTQSKLKAGNRQHASMRKRGYEPDSQALQRMSLIAKTLTTADHTRSPAVGPTDCCNPIKNSFS